MHVILGVILILFTIPVMISCFSEAKATNVDEQVSLQYFYQPGCSICEEKDILIENFKVKYPSINLSKTAVVYGTNHSEYFNYIESLGFETPSIPACLFLKGSCVYLLSSSEITTENLELWYSRFLELEGDCPDWESYNQQMETNSWLSFVSGLITGLSPCVVLITAVVSSTLAIQNKKINLLKIFGGFLLGMFLMYVSLGFALVTTIELFASTFFGETLRIIFAFFMFFLGAWYIFDSFNEKSKLFGTAPKFKEKIKEMSTKGTFLYSFLLGFMFSFIKIPCVGGIMLALISGLDTNFSQSIGQLSLFYLGLFIPIIILMAILAFGVSREKIDTIRIKYRSILRIISGLLIIGLTYYAIADLEAFFIVGMLLPLTCIIFLIPLIKNSLKKKDEQT